MAKANQKSSSRKARGSHYRKVSTRASSPTRSSSPGATTRSPDVSSSSSNSSSDPEDIDLRTALEKQLFDLVNLKRASEVAAFLQENIANIDINKRDIEGLSILHHCVINNDEETMEVLLKYKEINYYDALLQAIKDNSVQIVIKLWNSKELEANIIKGIVEDIVEKMKTEKQKMVPGLGKLYGDDITPILMAAICGHYELIEFLYNKGWRLDRLHFPSCDCPECRGLSTDLKKSNNRIHLLQGLANPIYIAFMAGQDKSFDPILKSFEIIKDVEICIEQEPEFKDEYEEILTKIKKFPVEILDMCRNMEEAKILLRKKEGYSGVSSPPYPRILLAIDLEQKEFVAHTNAQAVLHEEWIGEPLWVPSSTFERFIKAALFFCIFLFFPLISVFLWFTLCCFNNFKFIKFIAAPVNRYYPNAISHLFFIIVIMCMNSAEKAPAYLGPPSHYLPWIVGFYAISHFISFLRHFFMSPKCFMRSGWNKFELINHIFFFITIALWIVLWKRQNSLGAVQTYTRSKHLTERGWLEPYDILLISEATTAIASTMAVLRFLKYVIFHETLGPLQIALGKMTGDIVKFAVFFFLIVTSFSLGTQHLYRPYGNATILCDVSSAMEAFAWSLFTLSDASSPDVPTMDLANDAHNHHLLTERVGTIIFIAHHIICVTILLNMLVGVMSSTYGKIIENVTVEWKYGRTKMWIYYIQDTIIPAPFNIIPNSLFLCNILYWLKTVMTKQGRKRAGCNFADCCYLNDDETPEQKKERERQYPVLIRRLLQRYFRSTSSIASEDAPALEDIKHVQNQVTELRKLTTMSLEYHSNPNSGTNVVALKTSETSPPPTNSQPLPPPAIPSSASKTAPN